MMRPIRLLCAAFLAAAFIPAAPTAEAHGPKPTARKRHPVAQPLVSVRVVDSAGFAFPSATHRGKVFVAGDRGERYELELRNNTRRRLEVVVSVDGRDVVSGESANFTRHRGYVLEPFGVVTIDGYRRTLDRVAAFRFSGVGDSYAARRGSARSAGVIGVAVFREQSRRRAPIAKSDRGAVRSRRAEDFVEFEPAEEPTPPRSSSAPPRDAKPKTGRSKSARRWSPPANRQELGTEFGESRHSAARRVRFVRRHSTRPDFTTNVLYDTARALAARGVPIEASGVAEFEEPNPWTGGSAHGFAPPPPRR